MSITIRLPHHDHYEVRFSKEWFTTMFPHSLIVLSLQDPDVEEIALDNSSIIPGVLDLLLALSRPPNPMEWGLGGEERFLKGNMMKI